MPSVQASNNSGLNENLGNVVNAFETDLRGYERRFKVVEAQTEEDLQREQEEEEAQAAMEEEDARQQAEISRIQQARAAQAEREQEQAGVETPELGQLQVAAGQVSGAAEQVAGLWLIDFMWGSLIEVFPGALYALPFFNVYLLISIFKREDKATGKNVFWHQLGFFQTLVILLLDAVLVLLFILIIYVVFWTLCSTGIKAGIALTTFSTKIYSMCSSLGL